VGILLLICVGKEEDDITSIDNIIYFYTKTLPV